MNLFIHKYIFTTFLVIVGYGSQDRDNNTFLLQSLDNKYVVSYNSSKEHKVLKENSKVFLLIDADCEAVKGIDEPMSNKLGQWVDFDSYICTANKVVIK